MTESQEKIPVREKARGACALGCPSCLQVWLTIARRGERFICRACRHAFRAGVGALFEEIEGGRFTLLPRPPAETAV